MIYSVASERGEDVGGTVGYQIRLENKFPSRGYASIMYCTTGILLRRLQVFLINYFVNASHQTPFRMLVM